ncbi:uncharacterized protein LOC116219471 isoform X1 [Clupea harengus]|uniref:Uncharacterized protein LOC116219471 isoform X1 n=1 Tax=Clupea harengus TaxID=7950 RepID=A0A8M1K6U8_CLUHA|nr:uncharacterized protein LOC116219471 isoform X1 [Clupea harengus]
MRVQLSATLTILSLTLNTVSSVGLSVLEGSPVTLITTQHDKREDILNIKWFYNQTANVVYYVPTTPNEKVADLFKGRVEFNKTDFSLTLKNPQRSDSGLYTAVVETLNKGAEAATSYELSVLAPVVAPTLTVVSNWSSSDSCNVTLKCTGLNVSLISSCNGTFCSQEGGDRFLSIAFNHTIVSCNHSNPVSWRQTTMELEPLCPSYEADVAPPAGISPCLLKALLLSVGLIVMVTAVITVHISYKLQKTK